MILEVTAAASALAAVITGSLCAWRIRRSCRSSASRVSTGGGASRLTGAWTRLRDLARFKFRRETAEQPPQQQSSVSRSVGNSTSWTAIKVLTSHRVRELSMLSLFQAKTPCQCCLERCTHGRVKGQQGQIRMNQKAPAPAGKHMQGLVI